MDSQEVLKPVSTVTSNPPPKRLVLCFDGTGNQFNANETDSNIVKIYEMLDRTTNDQYHYYQPGIGTYEEGQITNTTNNGFFKNLRVNVSESNDQMFGTSFVHHVLGGYQFLLRYYAPGDKIYIFGFSRGAYTARFLSEMIDNIGLLSRGNDVMIRFAWDTFSNYQRLGGKLKGDQIDADAQENAADDYDSDDDAIYSQFRNGPKPAKVHTANPDATNSSDAPESSSPVAKSAKATSSNTWQSTGYDSDIESLDALGKKGALYTHGAGRPSGVKPKDKKQAKEYMDIFRSTFCRAGVKIYFLGLFDCVNSVAQFSAQKNNSPYIPRAPARHIRHALSIHERRANFRPSLFLLDGNNKAIGNVKTLEEVWFAGNHGDIGGGWSLNGPKDRYLASDLALKWMVEEVRKLDNSKRNRLIWHEEKVQWLQVHVNNQRASWDPKNHRTKGKGENAILSARKRLHDPLAYKGGLTSTQVTGWRFLETLPFSRWEYVQNVNPAIDPTWVFKRIPPNYGAARDIPEGSYFHNSIQSMLEFGILDYMPQSKDETKTNWFRRFLRFLVDRELRKPKTRGDIDHIRWIKDADDQHEEATATATGVTVTQS